MECINARLYDGITIAKLERRFDYRLEASRVSLAVVLSMITVAPYIGGKRRLIRQIVALLPPHQTYVEVFGGGGGVLLNKPPSRVEAFNDIDDELVNLFRVLQSHHEELLRYLRFVVVSRTVFAQLKATDPRNLTDIQRAARYLYLLRNSFAALVRNPAYHINVVQPPSFNITKLPEMIEAAHRRLARVQIECLPYGEILERFDRPSTVFYLDPPYWKKKLYKFNFSESDFKELAERLSRIRGKFLLSLNDVPEVRQLFGKFHVRGVELPYSAQRQAGKRYRELLIANYRLRQVPRSDPS